MKSPRFLAALAMAAVLTTGVTAHAASGTTGFHEVTSGTSGQASMQQANDFKSGADIQTQSLDATGDIRVDGKFTKTINNFPHPDKDGHYLRVTMPIKMDFTYDIDSHQMIAAQGTVMNNSVEAKGVNPGGVPNNGTLTPKKVKMTIVDFEDNGIGNMNSIVEFVNDANGTTPDRVELPFRLNITGKGGADVKNYTIKNIKDFHDKIIQPGDPDAISPITIAENTSIKLEINTIPGQEVKNTDLITNQTSLTSHNLKLKFEYIKN